MKRAVSAQKALAIGEDMFAAGSEVLMLLFGIEPIFSHLGQVSNIDNDMCSNV